MEQRIRAIMMIEVAGRPPQYLTDSLKAHVEKINVVKGVKVTSSKIAEARKLDEEKDLYTSFAEVEIETTTFGKLNEIILDFMPSSVEIIEPADIYFDCQEATMISNDLAGRLHKYDEVAKVASMQIQQLNQKIQLLQSRSALQARASPIQPIKISMDGLKEETSHEPSSKNKKKKPTKKSNKNKR